MYLMQETNKKNFSIWLSFMSENVYLIYYSYMLLIGARIFVNKLKSIHLVWRVIVFKIIYEKRKENV